jgi:hypothetical protein
LPEVQQFYFWVHTQKKGRHMPTQKLVYGWMQWYISVIPAFLRLRQEDHNFETNLGYIARPCLKKQNKSQGS